MVEIEEKHPVGVFLYLDIPCLEVPKIDSSVVHLSQGCPELIGSHGGVCLELECLQVWDKFDHHSIRADGISNKGLEIWLPTLGLGVNPLDQSVEIGDMALLAESLRLQATVSATFAEIWVNFVINWVKKLLFSVMVLRLVRSVCLKSGLQLTIFKTQSFSCHRARNTRDTSDLWRSPANVSSDK